MIMQFLKPVNNIVELQISIDLKRKEITIQYIALYSSLSNNRRPSWNPGQTTNKV